MALFRNKLQISSINFTKYGESNELLKNCSNLGSEIFVRSIQFLWPFKQKKSNETNCGECKKKQLDNPLISTGNPSKCLKVLEAPKKKSWFSKDNGGNSAKIVNNCEEEETCKPKQSFWNYLFGGEKKKLPDPCTCRMAYKYKETCREEDPRLCDPRYTATPGDVLLYTEYPKPTVFSCREPQPKPPPSYKIPKEVTCKKIAHAVAENTCFHLGRPQKEDDCIRNKSFDSKPFRLPYEELRPYEQKIVPFPREVENLAEDVVERIRRQMYPSSSDKNIDSETEPPENFLKDCTSDNKSTSNTCDGRIKLSRTERLKMLIIAAKQNDFRS